MLLVIQHLLATVLYSFGIPDPLENFDPFSCDTLMIVIGVLRETEMVRFSNGVSKYSKNSVYHHHQNTLKPRFTTISVFTYRKIFAVSQNVFAVSRVKRSQNPDRSNEINDFCSLHDQYFLE